MKSFDEVIELEDGRIIIGYYGDPANNWFYNSCPECNGDIVAPKGLGYLYGNCLSCGASPEISEVERIKIKQIQGT